MQNIHWVERLAVVLAERGLTQDQLARRLGKSQATVSRWITGFSYPKIDVEQRLADELGVSRQWLMTGEGTREQPRVSAHERSKLLPNSPALRRSSWRYDRNVKVDSTAPTAEDVRVREMLATIRLLIGDHTDQQIIARVHETLDDKNFSMPHRLTLAQALLDELHHRHQLFEPPTA